MPDGLDSPEGERLAEALIELARERGYRGISAERVCERAGLDPGVFGGYFSDLEDCFAAVWERTDREVGSRLEAAYDGDGEWPSRLRSALSALLGYLDADRARAHLYVVEVMRVSDAMRARREAAQARLAAVIDHGRENSLDAVPGDVSAAVAGAIWYRLETRLRREDDASLLTELPLMTYFAVLPYRGQEVAEAELRRDPPRR